MSTNGEPQGSEEKAESPLRTIFLPKQIEGNSGVSIDPRKWLARIFHVLTPPDIRKNMREKSDN
ncbi:MAG: hypothetical protein O3A80_00825 [bacterium]|nr:hypothetical protein [bacterium]MDA1292458.1 hypothetical protein [bacterium]